MRVTVENLHRRLASLKARFDAGGWKDAAKDGPALVSEARSIGYKPLVAETLAQEGAMLIRSNDTRAAEEALTEAFWAADAHATTSSALRSPPISFTSRLLAEEVRGSASVGGGRGSDLGENGRTRTSSGLAPERSG